MYPLTKHAAKKLREVADNMRPVMMNTHEKHIMTKEELDEMGFAHAEKLPTGSYIYKAPVQLAFNHYRALKKAFKAKGFSGCAAYITRINNLK